MPDAADLIDQVGSTLAGHADFPAMGALVADLTAGATSLAVDFGSNGFIQPAGVLEIGRELLAVRQYDATTGTVSLFPWGRGHRGTTAAAHSAGDLVTVAPRFPRQRILEALNQAVAGAVPDVYAVRDLDPIVIGDDVDLGYPLPEDTLRVLRVEAQSDGPFASRRLIRNWTVRTIAGVKALEVDDCDIRQTLLVTIAATPGRLVDDGDDFTGTTGLSEGCSELAVFGACARMVLAGEASRLQSTTPEADARADKVPNGSATALARMYQAMYQQRLASEQARLQQTYPINLLRRG